MEIEIDQNQKRTCALQGLPFWPKASWLRCQFFPVPCSKTSQECSKKLPWFIQNSLQQNQMVRTLLVLSLDLLASRSFMSRSFALKMLVKRSQGAEEICTLGSMCIDVMDIWHIVFQKPQDDACMMTERLWPQRPFFNAILPYYCSVFWMLNSSSFLKTFECFWVVYGLFMPAQVFSFWGLCFLQTISHHLCDSDSFLWPSWPVGSPCDTKHLALPLPKGQARGSRGIRRRSIQARYPVDLPWAAAWWFSHEKTKSWNHFFGGEGGF